MSPPLPSSLTLQPPPSCFPPAPSFPQMRAHTAHAGADGPAATARYCAPVLPVVCLHWSEAVSGGGRRALSRARARQTGGGDSRYQRTRGGDTRRQRTRRGSPASTPPSKTPSIPVFFEENGQACLRTRRGMTRPYACLWSPLHAHTSFAMTLTFCGGSRPT